jgi:hypothetical protein
MSAQQRHWQRQELDFRLHSNLWFSKAAKHFLRLVSTASKLLSAHMTGAAAERNWSARGRMYTALHASLSFGTAKKMTLVKANMSEEWHS